MSVYAINSKVFIGEKIEAIITGICIRRYSHVTYECSWWDKNTHNLQWFEEFEISSDIKKAQTENVGFKY